MRFAAVKKKHFLLERKSLCGQTILIDHIVPCAFIQENVSFPGLQHQCSGSVRPLQRLRGRGSGGSAPLEVPGRQVGPMWEGGR